MKKTKRLIATVIALSTLDIKLLKMMFSNGFRLEIEPDDLQDFTKSRFRVWVMEVFGLGQYELEGANQPDGGKKYVVARRVIRASGHESVPIMTGMGFNTSEEETFVALRLVLQRVNRLAGALNFVAIRRAFTGNDGVDMSSLIAIAKRHIKIDAVALIDGQIVNLATQINQAAILAIDLDVTHDLANYYIAALGHDDITRILCVDTVTLEVSYVVAEFDTDHTGLSLAAKKSSGGYELTAVFVVGDKTKTYTKAPDAEEFIEVTALDGKGIIRCDYNDAGNRVVKALDGTQIEMNGDKLETIGAAPNTVFDGTVTTDAGERIVLSSLIEGDVPIIELADPKENGDDWVATEPAY